MKEFESQPPREKGCILRLHIEKYRSLKVASVKRLAESDVCI